MPWHSEGCCSPGWRVHRVRAHTVPRQTSSKALWVKDQHHHHGHVDYEPRHTDPELDCLKRGKLGQPRPDCESVQQRECYQGMFWSVCGCLPWTRINDAAVGGGVLLARSRPAAGQVSDPLSASTGNQLVPVTASFTRLQAECD